MTQHQLIIEYLQQHSSILPAKMAGVIFMGQMFGSETSKRCRELRKSGQLYSEQEGKFERFYLKPIKYQEFRVLDDQGRIERIIKLAVK